LHGNMLEDTEIRQITDCTTTKHTTSKQLVKIDKLSVTVFPTEQQQLHFNALHSDCAECVRLAKHPKELAHLLKSWNELSTLKKQTILWIVIGEEEKT